MGMVGSAGEAVRKSVWMACAIVIACIMANLLLVACSAGGHTTNSASESVAANRDTASESSETAELADVVDATSDADTAANVSSSAQDQAAVEPVESSEPDVSYLYPWVVDVRAEGDKTYVYDYNEAGQLVSITGQQEEHLSWDTQIAKGVESVEISYDDAGRIAHIKPGTPLAGTIDLSYDERSRVSNLVHEWFAPGRFPEAGQHTETVTYEYDDTGALVAGSFHEIVEDFETVENTYTRSYSTDTDPGFDGAIHSDEPVPLVMYSATSVRSGQNVFCGADAQYDDTGNLVYVEIPGGDAVSYTYKQIKVEKGTWWPNALSNPTIKTFLYDGLSWANYTTFFPPQLSYPEMQRVLEVPDIDVEPGGDGVTENSDEVSAEPTTAQEIIDTPYYSFTVPEEYANDYDYRIEAESLDVDQSGFGMAYHAFIVLGASVGSMEGQRIEVALFTDNWGVQGQYNACELGEIPSAPGWHAVIYSPENSSDSTNPEDYANLVILK